MFGASFCANASAPMSITGGAEHESYEAHVSKHGGHTPFRQEGVLAFRISCTKRASEIAVRKQREWEVRLCGQRSSICPC